jgi:hypothetical protein
MGIKPRIDSDSLPYVMERTKPAFRERMEQYLLAAGKVSTLDQAFLPAAIEFIGISYSDNANELAVILTYLVEEGLMTKDLSHRGERRLTAKGFIAADELRTQSAASSQAFVAMALTDDMLLAYREGLEPGISGAGYKPMLISKKEHANKIDDEIIAEIRRSAFLVADFTHHRQNVYFETGFAIGLDRRVIWTCKKEQIGDLHFDVRQYNCIDWKDHADLAKRLQLRIEAMLGKGPVG